MAEVTGLNIVATFDATQFKKGVEEIQGTLNSLKSGFSTAFSASGAGNSFRSIASGARDSQTALQKVKTEIRDVRTEMTSLALSGQQGGARFSELANRLGALSTNLTNAEAAVKGSLGPYAQLQQTANALTRQANDLGAALGVDSKEFIEMSAAAKRATDQLKAIDAASGRNFRNVGNYSSAFNGVGNSLGQLAREMPAFTNSIQTGLIGISNNIPILVDSIRTLRAENTALAAAGKPTTSVFQALTSSVSLFNIGMSVGITLLTVYGPRLYEMAKGMFSAASASNQLKTEQEALGKAITEANNQTGSEIARLQVIQAALNSNTVSAKNKKLAYGELVKIGKEYGVQLDKEYNKTFDLTNVTRELTNAIIASAAAKAKEARIAEISNANQRKDEERFAAFKKRLRAQQEIDRLKAAGRDQASRGGSVGVGAPVIGSVNEWERAQGAYNEANRDFNQLTRDIDIGNKIISVYADEVANASNQTKVFDDGLKKKKTGLSEDEKITKRLTEANRDFERQLSDLGERIREGSISDLDALRERAQILDAQYKRLRDTFNVSPNTDGMKAIRDEIDQIGEVISITDKKYQTSTLFGGVQPGTVFQGVEISAKAGEEAVGRLDAQMNTFNRQMEAIKNAEAWKIITPTEADESRVKSFTSRVMDLYNQIQFALKAGNLGLAEKLGVEFEEAKKVMQEANFKAEISQMGERIDKFLKESLVGGIVAVGEGIGNAISGLENPFSALLSFLGGALKQLGEYMIQVGTMKIIIDTAIEAFAQLGGGVVGVVAGIAAVALGQALQNAARQKSSSSFRNMAEGGILRGETFIRAGEYPGASTNPEVVAPLNDLTRIMDGVVGGAGGVVVLDTKIKGSDLVLVQQRQTRYNNR